MNWALIAVYIMIIADLFISAALHGQPKKNKDYDIFVTIISNIILLLLFWWAVGWVII